MVPNDKENIALEVSEDLKTALDRYLEERKLCDQNTVIQSAIAQYLTVDLPEQTETSVPELMGARQRYYRTIGAWVRLERHMQALEEDDCNAEAEAVFHFVYVQKMLCRVAIDRLSAQIDAKVAPELLPRSWQLQIADHHLDGGVFSED